MKDFLFNGVDLKSTDEEETVIENVIRNIIYWCPLSMIGCSVPLNLFKTIGESTISDIESSINYDFVSQIFGYPYTTVKIVEIENGYGVEIDATYSKNFSTEIIEKIKNNGYFVNE